MADTQRGNRSGKSLPVDYENELRRRIAELEDAEAKCLLAESNLADSKNLLHAVIDSIHVSLAVVDAASEKGRGTTFSLNLPASSKKIPVKVLLASGYSISGQASDIMAQGCNGFIQKSFTPADLSTKIRKVFD